MRQLIYSINITMDGCCDHTKFVGGDDILEYFSELLRGGGALLYGRKTYQLMVPFWPDMAKDHSGPTKAMNDFADAFDAVGEIVVFSRSLENGEGKNTRIVRGDLKDEVAKMKQEPGGPILLGGVDLPSQLITSGLIDEYRIVVQPVLAGEGRRLFDDVNLPEKLDLKLIESKVLASGSVALRYVKH
jgi:dihydrofolate reductase